MTRLLFDYVIYVDGSSVIRQNAPNKRAAVERFIAMFGEGYRGRTTARRFGED